MKISFDMSSLSSATTTSGASSSSSSSLSATSVRDVIISYARDILPSLPASFYDFVPFTLAAIMALLFTALLVLLVEDSDDVNPATSSRQSVTSSSASLKSSPRSSKRIVGLAERDKDAESGDDEWEPSPWDPRADLDPTNGRNLKQSQNWMAIQNEKIATSHGYRTTNKRLLASPPSSASPQSPAFNPPMLSMAKLIMHRHDQSTKRVRSSKTASSSSSLPPSPPPTTSTTTSFGSMQYTLKSAALKSDKLAIVAFPTTEQPEQASSNQPLPPQRSSPDEPQQQQQPQSSQQKAPPSHTRHARNRSVALPSISLPSLNSIPALVPTLPLLQSKSSQDRTVRRSPSRELEEGGSSNESLPIHSRKSSSERVTSINDDSEVIKSNERRPSEAIVELEKGHTTSR